jgi:hypothetical protein
LCSRPGSSGARFRPYTVRTDDTPKVRFSATLGEESEVEAEKERKRKAERDAKLQQTQEEGKAEERRAKESARRQWKVSGGTEAAFEEAWPSMWEEMLKRRTMDAERGAREDQRASGVSRI